MAGGRKMWVPVLAAALLSSGAGLTWAQNADNTRVNERDRLPGEVTADEQSQSSGDLELTRKIRRAILDNTNLSSYAHNVKVIVSNGMVILKGPVDTIEEKATVEGIAAGIAGEANVQSQIDINS